MDLQNVASCAVDEGLCWLTGVDLNRVSDMVAEQFASR